MIEYFQRDKSQPRFPVQRMPALFADPSTLNANDGAQGAQGNSTSGTQGPQGFQGDQGAQGEQGAGEQGPQGFQGFQGNQGFQGDQGDQGVQGAGEQGPQGYQGFQGDQGNAGDQGQKGDSGDQGPQGEKGAMVKAGNDIQHPYVRLFCVEAPEIWFFDFVRIPARSKQATIDPLFVESCETGSLFIQAAHPARNDVVMSSDQKTLYCLGCDQEIVATVFGVRKGFNGVRFTRHTQKQFEQNMKFWSQQFDKAAA